MPDASTPVAARLPRYTLLQLSDVHLTPAGGPPHDRVDADAHLESAVRAAAGSGVAVSGVLLTGDLADDGHPAAYRRLRAAVEPWAAGLGIPVVYAMGNHDDRAAFRAELLDPSTARPPEAVDHDSVRSRGAQRTDDARYAALTTTREPRRRPPEEPLADEPPHDAVQWIGGLRVVVLDSTTPGRPDGYLTDDQLGWLRSVLLHPAADGTVLVLHHPPIPSPVPLVELIALREPERLAAVVAGTDVRIIVSGHAHHAAGGQLAGIPVWVSPATAYGADLLPPAGRVRAIAVSACSRIDLFADTVVASVVPLGAATVFDRPEADLPRLVGEADWAPPPHRGTHAEQGPAG